jgi:regulator of protease activity HflC (stomatin/prohibitin superfamily)
MNLRPTRCGIAALLVVALGTTGCVSATVSPGHRGLFFAPNDGGLHREALMPGRYRLGWCFIYCTPNRIEDFDVTYSAGTVDIDGEDADGRAVHLRLTVEYKPIESELYELDTDIGPNYYATSIAPELRSAGRSAIARYSFDKIQHESERFEEEVESDLRRRTAGHHLEIASVTIDSVS